MAERNVNTISALDLLGGKRAAVEWGKQRGQGLRDLSYDGDHVVCTMHNQLQSNALEECICGMSCGLERLCYKLTCPETFCEIRGTVQLHMCNLLTASPNRVGKLLGLFLFMIEGSASTLQSRA